MKWDSGCLGGKKGKIGDILLYLGWTGLGSEHGVLCVPSIELRTCPSTEFILSDRLCENSIGALRQSSGRTVKYLISVRLASARGERVEP